LTVGFIEAPESGDFKRLLATRLRSTLLELDDGPVSRAVKRALGDAQAKELSLANLVGRAGGRQIPLSETFERVRTGDYLAVWLPVFVEALVSAAHEVPKHRGGVGVDAVIVAGL
jgi:hypothetical protein